MIYLDNSATTKPRQSVTDEYVRAAHELWINPSAAYAQALDSEKALDRARRSILRSVGGTSIGSVVFTGGGTEGDNLAIMGTCYARARTMHHLVTDAVEHPAVSRSCEFLEKNGWRLTTLPVTEQGVVDPAAVADAVCGDTAIVSIMHVNNETGAVNDVRAIAEAVKAKNPKTLVHVDAVQAYLRVPIDLSKTKIDLYSASGHKIHGPKGVGFLFLRRGVTLDGVALGGGQEMGLRSGTQNTPGILALERAVLDWDDADIARVREIKEALYREVCARVDGVRRNGPDEGTAAPHILNLGFSGVRAETLLHALEERDVLVATGSACSSRHRRVSFVLDAMHVPEEYLTGSIRLSFGIFNTMDEVVPAAEAIAECVTLLRRFKAR